MQQQNEVKVGQLTLRSGQVLDERYSVESFIGRGGMCSVFKTEDLQLHRTVAIKILNQAETSLSVKRFQREAAAISSLRHKNIVQVFGFGLVDDLPYMVLEFLQGESLGERINTSGPLDRATFVSIISQICDGLNYAHTNGVVHRDLKPSNIMLLPDGTAKIVDFGIAKVVSDDNKELQKLTQTGEIFGTLGYISPEQAIGSTTVDGRTDVYALGCIMYEALTGKPAFEGDSPYEVIANHLGKMPPRVEGLGDFADIVFACLAKEQTDRPANAELIANALRGGTTKIAAPVSLTPGPKIKSKATVLAVLAAIAVIAAACLLAPRSHMTQQIGKNQEAYSELKRSVNRARTGSCENLFIALTEYLERAPQLGEQADIEPTLREEYDYHHKQHGAKERLTALILAGFYKDQPGKISELKEERKEDTKHLVDTLDVLTDPRARSDAYVYDPVIAARAIAYAKLYCDPSINPDATDYPHLTKRAQRIANLSPPQPKHDPR